MAEELRQQVPVMKEVLRAMKIKIVEQEGLEADDLLGTIAGIGERAGMDVAILSGDRDLLQLATDHVKIRIPKTKQGKTEIEDYYAADVKARYQVTPQEFIDLKALMGDASDNIPGVPSIGEKTATKIITEYGSVENAYAHVEELKPPRAAKALKEHYDKAQMSKILATIEVNAPISYELSEAKIGNLYTEEAYEYFQKLQFKNLLGRFDVEAKGNQIENAFVRVTDKQQAEELFARAGKETFVGVSFGKEEKDAVPLFSHSSGFGSVGLAFSEKEIYTIVAEGELTMEDLFSLVGTLAKTTVVALFDVKAALSYVRIEDPESCFDVGIAAYLLNPLKSDYTWLDVAAEHLSLLIDEKTEGYCRSCYEAYVIWAAAAVLEEKMKESGTEELFRTIEMPLLFTLFAMEQAGVRVEAEALRFYGEQLGTKIVELEKEIYAQAGEAFNINSPKQLGVILFEKLKLPHGKKTKTGYSTAADVLDKLAPEYPVVEKILEYRQLTKLKSTYADGLANYICADGRIHGKFNQTITATGRISSTEPNLQNIPVRMELGRLIRKVFIPEEGYVFVDADYSQIELRVLAHIANDETMINAFRNNEDIHAVTASQVLGIPLEDVTKEQRSSAKAVNFGIVYGIGEFSLAQDLHISVKEAKAYIESYLEKYHGVRNYMESIKEQAKKDGYVKTMLNRIRYIPELKSPNYNIRQFGERVALNTPIQGTAADIIKLAMVRVDNRLINEGLKSKLILQVHDELIVEAHKDEVDKVKQILSEEMQSAMELNVPLKVDMSTGHSWYDAK